jgi:hypothetical protein
MKRNKKMKGISRIDSKNTHGWYVRIYADSGVFTSKLFSDRLYGSKDNALKNAIAFRDHNQMVADIHKAQSPRKARKPYFERPAKNNTSGIVGVNEVKTTMKGREVHYFQSTWSEDGKPRSKKFYVNSTRTFDEAKKMAVEYRKMKEKEMKSVYEKA